MRVEHGTLLVQNGLTHYPQQRERWRLFPGDWRLPARIVIVDGNGGLSLDAIAWLAECDVPLIRVDWRGEVVHVTGATRAIDQKLRDAQLAARANGRWLTLARHLIAEKIDKSIDTLRHVFPRSPAIELAVTRIKQDAELMRRNPPSSVSDLLGVEGRVAVAYFGAWQSFPLRWKQMGRRPIPDDWKRVGSRASMVAGQKHGRNRNATHPVNAMLNYAYGVLQHVVLGRITGAALDPTVGYFHGNYRDKTALVYDVMEPLRPVVDRRVLELVKKEQFSPADFSLCHNGTCRLHPALARIVVQLLDEDVDLKRGLDQMLQDLIIKHLGFGQCQV
ncbi:MAG TPA: CRISPR-associated endonuclease Cas1 [Bradyrhizobium sp.]|nr:CRISPR-associated endonuclease Cas1 [Bradyrhizobium sp.]